MADEVADLAAKCEVIRKGYSPCDISDALLSLQIPSGGLLADIAPIPSRHGSANRLVAPISTLLFVPKAHQPRDQVAGDLLVPEASNLPSDKHFTDLAPAGSVVLMQQPPDQIAALLGDIVATRYQVRGIRGVFVDGRARDVVGIGRLCASGGGGGGAPFQAWTKALSSVGTSAEAKPWAADVPLRVGGRVVVRAGDVLCADEGEMVACVIPRESLDEVLALLPILKRADDGLLADVQGGMGFRAAVGRHPDHYTVRKH